MADAALPPPATIDIRQRVQAQAGRHARASSGSTAWPSASSPSAGSSSSSPCSFIFVFIFGEALPLFRPASGEATGTVTLAAVPPLERARRARRRAAAAPPRPPPPLRRRRLASRLRARHRRVPDVPLRSCCRTAGSRSSGAATARFAKQFAADRRWAAPRSRAASRSLERRLRGRRHRGRPGRAAAGPLPAALRGAEARRPRRSRCATAASSSSTRRSGRSARSPTSETTAARRWRPWSADDEIARAAARTTRAPSSARALQTERRRDDHRACALGRSDTAGRRRPRRATSTTGSWCRRRGSPRSSTSPSEPITALEYIARQHHR